MLKQTVNKNNIHVPVGVSQVSQLVVMILLINDCYVMSLVVIISRMNFVLYRNSWKNWNFHCYDKGRKENYNETIERIETFTATIEDENKTKQSSPLRLEKVKMPFFDGTIRQYPQFKKDFQKQVMPTVNKESACYILRSCLGKEATDTVKSMADNIQEMWKRLDEKYGDPAKVADAIINTVQNVRPIKEGENKKFIELVDAVEDGYNDLKKLGLEREITTTSSVSIIERKLPPEIRKEWAKLVSAEQYSRQNKQISKSP